MRHFLAGLIFSILITAGAFAQVGNPLQVEADTLALWNFDTNSDNTVVDISTSPLDGTIFGAQRLEVPDLDVAYLKGIQVSADNQFVDFGVTTGSKLDFIGAENFTVEAVIRLTTDASGDHVIFGNDQVQLVVINNTLGGFIRTASGFRGVVGNAPLMQNTNYRVLVAKKGNTIAVAVNGRILDSVLIYDPIVAPSYASARITVGGNIFGKFFPGYIDDVRVSSTAKIDVEKPTVTLVAPNTFSVSEPRPQFDITLADNVGIDVNAVEVYLNSVKQNNLAITATSIQGTMDEDFSSTIPNEVKVIVSDLNGNTIEQNYTFSYTIVGDSTEYDDDVNTLGLWHMNDFTPAVMLDSSSNNAHGYGDPKHSNIGDGVFGKGRMFNGTADSKVTINSVPLNSNQFTIEGWFSPASNNSNEEILFNSGQIKIARFNTGHIRVVFYETRLIENFESSQVLLPVGQLNHLAVTWDGTKKENNLAIFINGGVAQSFDACIRCDLNPIPQVGVIGQYFNGMMDEIRFSNIIRDSFNIPNSEIREIEFLNLTNGTSVSNNSPEFHATLNSNAGVDPAKVKVLLNGVEQDSSNGLAITATNIDGKLSDTLKLGINYLEVEFVDNAGMLKKESHYFFYYEKIGRSQDVVNNNHVVSYRFEAGGIGQDSSSNNYHVTNVTNISSDSGVIGGGAKGSFTVNNIQIDSRAFTMSGYFKGVVSNNSMADALFLSGPEYSAGLGINATSGAMNIRFSTPDFTLNKTVHGLFPTDGEFHHIAMIFNPSLGHSQLIVLVDGEVKQAIDVFASCNLSGNSSFNVGYSSYFVMDEVNIVKESKNSFRVSYANSSTAISSTDIQDGITLNQNILTATIDLSSSVGINNEGNKVLLNGTEVSGLTLVQTGTNATLSGDITGFIGGANAIEVHSVDLNGNQDIKSFMVYYFAQGTGEYIPDESTEVLLHMNETTGSVFMDQSGKGNDFNFSGWVLNESGVFGSVGAKSYSDVASANLPSMEGLSTYTIELWKKNIYSSSSAFMFNHGGVLFNFAGNRLYFRGENYTQYDSEYTIIPDSAFHHYAVVVDTNHPIRQLYILEDGKVLKSFGGLTAAQLALGASTTMNFGEYFYNDVMDEFRFSSSARYILNSSLSK